MKEDIKTVLGLAKMLYKKRNIMIYGAGKVGKIIFQLLKDRDIMITAFIVTSKVEKERIEEIPVPN